MNSWFAFSTKFETTECSNTIISEKWNWKHLSSGISKGKWQESLPIILTIHPTILVSIHLSTHPSICSSTIQVQINNYLVNSYYVSQFYIYIWYFKYVNLSFLTVHITKNYYSASQLKNEYLIIKIYLKKMKKRKRISTVHWIDSDISQVLGLYLS